MFFLELMKGKRILNSHSVRVAKIASAIFNAILFMAPKIYTDMVNATDTSQSTKI